MKPLTLVYLMAAASSVTFASATASTICTGKKALPASTNLTSGGAYEAFKCDGSVGPSISFVFDASLGAAATFAFTGDSEYTYANTMVVSMNSAYPVTVSFDSVRFGYTSSLSFDGFVPSGSSITVSNSRFDTTSSSQLNFYPNTIVGSRISFTGNTFVTLSGDDNPLYIEAEGTDGMFNHSTFTIHGNTFDGPGTVRFDPFTSGGVGNTFTFDQNTLIGAIFTFVNNGDDNTMQITGNPVTDSDFQVDQNGGVTTVSGNTFNGYMTMSSININAPGPLAFTGNTFVCPDSGMWWQIYMQAMIEDSKLSFSRNTFSKGCDANMTLRFEVPSVFPSGVDVAIDGNVFTIGSEMSSPLLTVSQDAFYAYDGIATVSLSGNDFRFANGVKPQNASDEGVPLIHFESNDLKARQMKQQQRVPLIKRAEKKGLKKNDHQKQAANGNTASSTLNKKKTKDASAAAAEVPRRHSIAAADILTNLMKLKLKDNIVAGKVLSSPEQFAAYFSNFDSLQSSVGSGLDFSQTPYSGASSRDGIIAGALVAAVVALLTVA